jgi:hypothetical protein
MTKTLRRFTPKSPEMEIHTIPDDWNVKVYSDDVDEIINCADCGKEIRYGDSYTSLEIQSRRGFSYCVCKDCSDRENLRQMGGRTR